MSAFVSGPTIGVSSYYYMCPHTTTYYMCPCNAIYLARTYICNIHIHVCFYRYISSVHMLGGGVTL